MSEERPEGRVIEIRLDLSIAARWLKLPLAALLFFCTATELGSEDLTLTTYYPAPSAVYFKLITTSKTILATDAGSKVIVGSYDPATVTAKLAISPDSGGNISVGIGTGTFSPSATLDVRGDVMTTGNLSVGGELSTVSSMSVASLQAGNELMAKDFKVQSQSVIVNIKCATDLVCTRTGNKFTIAQAAAPPPACVPNGSCNAPTPLCEKTTFGTDNCGNACQKTGPTCLYACGACSLSYHPNACEGYTEYYSRIIIIGSPFDWFLEGQEYFQCIAGAGTRVDVTLGGSGTCSAPTTTWKHCYTTCVPGTKYTGSCSVATYCLYCTSTNVPIN